MSKYQDTFKKMLAEAKSSWHWELAVAGNNLQWNLYTLRHRKGWTMRELGKRIGVAQPHIVRHESWGYMPSMDSLAKYAHVYGVTIADLLGEPMHFPPHDMYQWNDETGEYIKIGTYETKSTAHTITKTVQLKDTNGVKDE